MSEQADLYVIKNKNNDNFSRCEDPTGLAQPLGHKVSIGATAGCYIITVKNGKKPRDISQYKYSVKKLKDLLTKDTIKNYEIVFFKKVSYGSIYELKQIKRYYIDELKAIN